ncbi:hypothetical protein KIL84_008383 [Mauremys mutica]|uniref:Uncharacterized protein n=1 Tax=Mauremys mutica TaxID=74926 RepID=A0A9D3X501_9SAUR|nr:hypothetical protein KIL84_008383 [Mauremys mutica]
MHGKLPPTHRPADKTVKFIPLQQQCNGQDDCSWGEDEENCVQQVPEGPPVEGELWMLSQ